MTRPRSTFAAVVAHPRWAGVLALWTAASFAASAGLIATEVGQVALVDHWERTALAFGHQVDDARYAQMQEMSRHGVAYAAATAMARGPGAAAVLAGVLYGVFAVRGRRARFVQVMAVVAHAGVILALRDVVAAPLNYIRESLASPVTLGQFLGVVDEASPMARFVALVDAFLIWWIVVLAIGLAVLYQTRTRTVAAGLMAAYAGIAILLAGTMAVLGAKG